MIRALAAAQRGSVDHNFQGWQLRIRGIRLPNSETFPCSRRRIKELFAAEELAWVSFGSSIRTFRFDHQVAHRPQFVGPVVASLAVDRDLESHLCVYPIARGTYP